MYRKRYSFLTLEAARLDTDYYQPEAIEALETIKQHHYISLEQGGSVWGFGAYELCNEIEISLNAADPIFLKISDIQEPFVALDQAVRVTSKTHSILSAAHVSSGDIIVSIAGTIGACAIIPEHEQLGISANQAIAKYRCEVADPYFVIAYFMSQQFKTVINREAGGAIQKNLYLYNFASLPLLTPSDAVQTYIGDKVRQVERLRERSRSCHLRIREILRDFALPDPPKGRTQRVEPGEIMDSLNPNAYMPRFMKAEKVVRSYHHQSIKSLSKNVADGPFGSNLKVTDYKTGSEAKHPVIRVKNCENGYLEVNDLVWINSEKQRELSRSTVLPGDLLVTKAGRIGSAAVYFEGLPPGNITSHLIRARLKHGINPYYVAEFLETDVGRAITERHSFKSTRPELTKVEVESCNVALLEHDLMEQVGELARTRNEFTQYSEWLTTAAKLLVEALIENNITELELQEAQEALQRGENTLDRQILSRLTRKGIPRRGETSTEPPLFPDLDALDRVLSSDDPDEDPDRDSTSEVSYWRQSPIHFSQRAAEPTSPYRESSLTLLDEEEL